MDRLNGKTVDCFVEFESPEQAAFTATRFKPSADSKRRQRVGDRNVTVELSSQEELMASMFSRASSVEWKGQQPVIRQAMGRNASAFRGFITPEELIATVKHVNSPQNVSLRLAIPSLY